MYREYATRGRDLRSVVASEVRDYFAYKVPHVIIDGLITNNRDARDLLLAIRVMLEDKYDLCIELVWWSKNIEDCLHNDRGRRKLKSSVTIEHVVFEEPSQEFLDEFGIKPKHVIRKRVVRKPAWKVWSEENHCGREQHMKSESWSLGGTSGSCWSDEVSHVSAGAQPTSFREFDELLERVYPTLTFLQYKRLYAESVTTETYGEGDYYGGHVEYARYVCDLKKLHEMLVVSGIIVE